MIVELIFPELIDRNTDTLLSVRAGVSNVDDEIEYKEGFDVELLVTEGSASPTSGVTNTEGYFESDISVTSTAENITILTTVKNPETTEETIEKVTSNIIQTDHIVVCDITHPNWDFRTCCPKGSEIEWCVL